MALTRQMGLSGSVVVFIKAEASMACVNSSLFANSLWLLSWLEIHRLVVSSRYISCWTIS